MMVVAGTVTVSLQVGADASAVKQKCDCDSCLRYRNPFLPFDPWHNWFDTGTRMDVIVKNQNRKGDHHISRFLNIYIIEGSLNSKRPTIWRVEKQIDEVK